MKTEQEQIEEMSYSICGARDVGIIKSCANCKYKNTCEKIIYAREFSHKGYRKASDVIGEFVERINLIECEMFHKAHDSRNYYEYKINNGNTEDRVWGGKRECDGKMVALQDFMTKIEKLAAEMRQEVEK